MACFPTGVASLGFASCFFLRDGLPGCGGLGDESTKGVSLVEMRMHLVIQNSKRKAWISGLFHRQPHHLHCSVG